ncbi:MAG: hypothetical protein NDJ89_04645 [Oligoflexia bacterium]|nr:hypothetical protein [Oligoflexia bacterium]
MTKYFRATGIVVAALFAITASAAQTKAPVFYPEQPDAPRIQFLKTFTGSNSLLPANPYGDRFPGFTPVNPEETNPLVKPYGMAMSGGKLYVCDMLRGLVSVLDLEKNLMTNFGEGKLSQPVNIAIAADGTRYVADVGLNRVAVYDSKDVLVKMFGKGDTLKPSDVLLSKGRLYVADLISSQILALDPSTGAELFRIGNAGSAAGELFKATNLAADVEGNIYAADTLNGRIAVFSETGKFLRNVGQVGDVIGTFTRPKGVALDRESRLFAVDAAFENVQVFNREDKLLMPFGKVGNIPGGLNMPAKVVVDYDHVKYFAKDVAPGHQIEYLILVSNLSGSNAVNVYGMLKQK